MALGFGYNERRRNEMKPVTLGLGLWVLGVCVPLKAGRVVRV